MEYNLAYIWIPQLSFMIIKCKLNTAVCIIALPDYSLIIIISIVVHVGTLTVCIPVSEPA